MTGRYNHRNYQKFGHLKRTEITFANLLRDGGYRTCIAGKWQLGGNAETVKRFGFDQHCLWNMIPYQADDPESLNQRPATERNRYQDPTLYRNGEWFQPGAEAYGPDVCTDFIIDFIRQKSDQPFFVYYPMILTHDPFVPTPDSPQDAERRQGRRGKKKNFQDMVAYMDQLVGRIVDTLDELEIRDQTLLIFTGDNGTHSSITSATKTGPYQGGKSFPINRGTHVPMYVSWPGKIKPGVTDALTDFSDVLPTLAEVGQVEPPQDRTIDGRSLVPVLTGQSVTQRDHVYFYYWKRGRDPDQVTVWVRDEKYMLYQDGRFYDLTIDPTQSKPTPPVTTAQRTAFEKLSAALNR